MSGNNSVRRGADLGPRHRSAESEADKARKRAKKDQEVCKCISYRHNSIQMQSPYSTNIMYAFMRI